eukprot:CAMPEP_0171986880 /NCGR_PEP_ID=MMETSP0993-20121228/275098_1 /TAXON_ID=483369 /ORGANISM="non described non described, Strain CCMP2098" /LENGTH=809 /DNA_ID=CAMNT_0012639801 /DNA_START=51 /DNA_END=2479 /DNA_ORIENTATION=-
MSQPLPKMYGANPSKSSKSFMKRTEEKIQAVLNGLGLDTSVPKDRLVRGVSVANILSGGESLMKPLRFDQYTDAEGETLFSRSDSVDHFDDFLSHSWRTSPLEKTIALRVLYNGRPAMVGATAMAIVFSFLARAPGLLPPMDPDRYSASVDKNVPLSAYSSFSGIVTFVVLFVYWQSMRPHLAYFANPILRLISQARLCWTQNSNQGERGRGSRGVEMVSTEKGGESEPCMRARPRMAFFDKLSIHQTDPSLKPAGIRSLGGFLKLSNRFVILWHSDYFTRLWCIYELAAFEFINGEAGAAVPSSNDDEEEGEAASAVLGARVGGGNKPKSLLFVPCPLAVIVAVCLAALFTAAGIFFFVLFSDAGSLLTLSNSASSAAYTTTLLAVAALCLAPAAAFAQALLKFAAARLELDAQLRSFDVRQAGCSDARDRERVEKSIAAWWGNSSNKAAGGPGSGPGGGGGCGGDSTSGASSSSSSGACAGATTTPMLLDDLVVGAHDLLQQGSRSGGGGIEEDDNTLPPVPPPIAPPAAGAGLARPAVVGAHDLLQQGSRSGGGGGGGIEEDDNTLPPVPPPIAPPALERSWSDPLADGLVPVSNSNAEADTSGCGSTSTAQRAAALDNFDLHVRTHIAAMVERITGKPAAPDYGLLLLTGVPFFWVSLDWAASFRNEPAGLQAAWILRGIVGAGLIPLLWHASLRAALPLAKRRTRAHPIPLGTPTEGAEPGEAPGPPVAAAPEGPLSPPQTLASWCLDGPLSTAGLTVVILGMLCLVFGAEYQFSQRLPLLDPVPAIIELAIVASATAFVWCQN